MAVGYRHGVPPVVVGLFLVGFSNGIWDVAMNVEGAAVEQRLGRSIMSRFHAGWSLGTVAGALIGAALVAGHVSVTAHLLIVSVVVALAVPYAVRGFLPAEPEPAHDDDRGHPLQAWTEPRTLLIGLFVLSAAFAEGTGNDWLGVVATDGYHASASAGALTLAIFLAAMTTGRWFGVTLLDRYGRVPVLRSTVAAAVSGLLLVVFGGSLALAMVGCVLWGLGASLGFPVGMSAAADDPVRAAGRVSVVASIGYVAFLAGPPIVGLIGNHLGVRHALTATIAVLALGLLVSGATRPLGGSEQDVGRSVGSVMRRRTASGPVLITSAAPSRVDEFNDRRRQYMIVMSIRVALLHPGRGRSRSPGCAWSSSSAPWCCRGSPCSPPTRSRPRSSARRTLFVPKPRRALTGEDPQPRRADRRP